MDEKTLSNMDMAIVYWWLKTRDIRRVAQHVHSMADGDFKNTKTRVKATLERIEVQNEIERQEDVLIHERMKIQANAENLDNTLLDKELLSLILLDPCEVVPAAEAKRKAIEMGYILTGRIESGNTRSLEAKEGPDAKPNFYQGVWKVAGEITVTPSPILPPEHKDHQFAIPAPPAKPEPVKGTVHSERPGKVRVF